MRQLRGDVEKGKVREDMWGKVLGPHTLTHFPKPPPFLLAHPFPTRQHASPLTLYTLPHPFPHIFLYLPHTPTHFPTPPPTPSIPLPTVPLTSPYTPTHFPTHPMHSPTPLATSSPTLLIMWRSYHVTMLP